jgi:hypothetical protein
VQHVGPPTELTLGETDNDAAGETGSEAVDRTGSGAGDRTGCGAAGDSPGKDRGKLNTSSPRVAGSTRLSRRITPDVLGLSWIVLVACAYLSPAVKDGFGFGAADLVRQLSVLTNVPGLVPHNGYNGDLLTQFAAWNLLDWHLVHSGQLPLWNDLSMTGMPQLLNFESAVLSLPTLIGYLAPASASFFVTVAVKLLVAGSGVYACCRALGTRPLGAAFGGSTAMLSGSFSGWLGWAVSGPEAWTGWLLCGAVLAYRRRGPAGAAVLAISTAFAIYAGMPESDALVAIGLGVVILVTGLLTLVSGRLDLTGALRIAIGLACGAALSAPLWLPGIAVLRLSSHAATPSDYGLPLKAAALLFAPGYYGLPTRGSHYFGPVNYYETAAYVGIPALVLAVVGLRSLRTRPVVVGLGVSAVVATLAAYRVTASGPVQALARHVGLRSVSLSRMVGVLGFLIAILAGIGLEELMRRRRDGRDGGGDRGVAVLLLAGSLIVAGVLVLLWVKVGDLGAAAPFTRAELVALRRSSLWWPSVEAVLCLGIATVLASRRWRHSPAHSPGTRRSASGAVLGTVVLVAESAFLVFAGVGLNSYAHDLYPVTPAVSALQRDAGNALVGFDGGNTSCPRSRATTPCGLRQWTGLAFYPVVNLAYGVAEFGGHDPVIPRTYFTAWPVPHDGQPPNALNLFAPSIDSISLARRYGIGYVLVPPNRVAPLGMTPVGKIASMTLYRVPGSDRFAFAASASTGASGSRTTDRVVSVRHPDDTSYDLTLSAPRAETLLIRITNTPGWNVTTGSGQALGVSPAAGGALLSVRVPGGTRSLVVHYWPRHFGLSLGLALGAALLLAVWATALGLVRRKR